MPESIKMPGGLNDRGRPGASMHGPDDGRAQTPRGHETEGESGVMVMRIDVHTHIFPPEIIWGRERHFESDPWFKLLYSPPKSRMASAGVLIDAMDEDGVDRAVVFGFPWFDTDTVTRHNDYILESAVKYSPRLIPLACVNPLTRSGPIEAERCLRAGAAGLGELAVYGPCDERTALGRFRDLFDCCRSRRSVLLVHANEPVGHAYPGKAPLGLDFYYRLAADAAGIPLIFAHWGGGLCFYELLKKEAREVLSNVYYDTAASPFLYDASIYRHMSEVLPAGKILFGSDYPLIKPARYFREMAESGLPEPHMQAICGGNAARLFGLT